MDNASRNLKVLVAGVEFLLVTHRLVIATGFIVAGSSAAEAFLNKIFHRLLNIAIH
jgi:hypothetical protein